MEPKDESFGMRDPNVTTWICLECGWEWELDMTPPEDVDNG